MCLRLDPDDLDVWQTKRLKRIRRLAEYIREVGSIETPKLLGAMGKNGIARRTAKRYLRDLKDSGDIEERDEKIIWIAQEEDRQREIGAA